MSVKHIIAECLSDKNLNRPEKALAVLISLGGKGSTSDIRDKAMDNGLRSIKTWNVSAILGSLEKGGAITKHGGEWEIRDAGRERVKVKLGWSLEEKLQILSTSPQHNKVLKTLRSEIENISNSNTKSFMNEVANCLEIEASRAAIIMSWVGAMNHLQDLALSKYAVAIDNAAIKRLSNPKKQHKGIKAKETFEEIKESDQLQIMMDAGMIGKTLKNQLIERLNMRNACGHPNTVSVNDTMAQAHVEFLILNVFAMN